MDDAHRTLEQRALRNVRDLVDRVEAQDRAQRVTDRHGLVVLAALIGGLFLLLAVGIFGTIAWTKVFPREPSPARSARAPLRAPDAIPAGQWASYSDHYIRKVDAAYKAMYPTGGLHGSVQVRVSIVPDGRLASMDVSRSSGNRDLDQAAMDIVTKAAPFDPFSSHSVTGSEIEIKRTFSFE